MMMRKSAWLLSAGLFAVATPAISQPTSQSNTDTDKQTAKPTPGATEGAAVQDQARQQQPVDTGDIVITATRRNQALSDVPMAVSAVTAENLRDTGATDIRQLNQVAPSLLVSSTSSEAGAAVARIRGVGTVGDNPGLESSVGLFIDGVYRSRTGLGLTDLGPIDRIEVLRGPQGTLFGRNTSAGLISIITAKPRFTPEVSGQLDFGNYAYRRVQASATGPVSDSIALRLDGVWDKRDGFLKDVISGRRVNDRDRWGLRGQMLFQPSDSLSFRLIADYSKQNEECCAAPFLPAHNTVTNGAGGVTEQPSTIALIERLMGGVIEDSPFKRLVSITPGRSYRSDVTDWGVSGELVNDFGWAELTSITAYRYNKYTRGQDADFNNLDILFRDDDGSAFNKFRTFTQELRLQGNTWNNRLDWLVGGYYANEKLTLRDNLAYGNDYGAYSNCLVAANFVAKGAPSSLLAPGSATCFNQTTAGLVLPALAPGDQSVLAAFARLGPFAGAPFTNSGFSNLAIFAGGAPFLNATLNGAALDDLYNQKSNNFAIFTHNIFSITPDGRLKLTLGARYTHEKKTLDAALTDNNVLCTFFAAAIPPLQTLPCVSPSVPGGSFGLNDSFSESKLSGTAVLSYKPTDRLLTYASYSHGYKAGGYNLDRSALFRSIDPTLGAQPFPLSGNGAICTFVGQPNCHGIVASAANDLRFKPEINDAFEIGAKFNGPGIDVNLALFHEVFKDFQLNTFNGLNFVVENINSCSDSLNGADRDNNPFTGACTGDLHGGVRSQGFELEAFTRPIRDVAWNAGLVMADTRYRDNLVGAGGKPLTNALFQLPGRQISNAPKWTATTSIAWTPPIGNSLRGLVYADARYMSSFNTGSDLDIEKQQKAFTVVNARIGVHDAEDRWGLEFWGQNVFNKHFMQVAFDAPLQGTGTTRGVEAGFYPAATQLYGAFLGEPRTFGVTLRAKMGFSRPAPEPYVAPPAPPPPPVVEQPAPPPPPPPPPPPAPVERGERG